VDTPASLSQVLLPDSGRNGPASLRGNAGPGQYRLRRALFIDNPVAGRHHPRYLTKQVAYRLRRYGWQVDVVGTAYAGHGISLAREAVSRRYDMVVACGGDGTINEVLQALAGTTTCLGVVPTGTANVWAGEAGLPRDAEYLTALLDHGPRPAIDIGRADSRLFLLMAGIGLDAAVVRRVQLGLKERFGRWAYVLSLLEQFSAYQGASVHLTLDGIVEEHILWMLVVGNTRRYAGYFRLTPQALIDDGRLDVCMVPGLSAAWSVPQWSAVLTGAPPLRKYLRYRRVREIAVQAARPLPIQVDGDPAGYTPVTITVLPGGVRMVMPDRRAAGLFGKREWRDAACPDPLSQRG
jgi:diacylglycerol kinase (ATP)